MTVDVGRRTVFNRRVFAGPSSPDVVGLLPMAPDLQQMSAFLHLLSIGRGGNLHQVLA